MSFRNFFKKDKFCGQSDDGSPASVTAKEKKALFGLKVVQAQQNPEPIYDLSGCSAPFLPNDTFTFCKILGKTTLNIKENCLTNLECGGSLQDLSELKVLDASYNRIEKLTIHFVFLKKLKVLNLSFNKLKTLPETFGELNCLEELYLTSNKFTKVPLPICALPTLRVLVLKDNNISVIPVELGKLQHSLVSLVLDFDKITSPSQSIICNGLEDIMRSLCLALGTEYHGPRDEPTSSQSSPSKIQSINAPQQSDDIMIEYMRKKQELLTAQILAEENLRAQEKEQLVNVLQNSSRCREELLHGLSTSPSGIADYEDQKQVKVQEQMRLEEIFRSEQDEQLGLYLNNTSNKESLLLNISANEDIFLNEVEAIVAAKEFERSRLLQDLTKVEEETDLAIQELVNIQQSQKSSGFINLVKQQEEEMQNIISGVVETSTELRHTEIMKAMQAILVSEAIAEAQRAKIEEKQRSLVSSLVKDGEVEACHLEQLMNNKLADQEIFLSDVLKEEEFQAEAFKLLLLKMDLKRNSVIRQIALVEYELIRLSTLEVRKKRFGVQYGSTTMLDQRKTLVGLLKSLLIKRDERDQELEKWVAELSGQKFPDLSTEDFWLLQYQRLMALKPAGLNGAEENVDSEVQNILLMANALDLVPIFAKHKIVFATLLDMSEEDFAQMSIGSATYHSIQRALHSHLSATKLGPQEPSAPVEEEDPCSFPPEIGNNEASAPPLPDTLESPSFTARQFVETECVICLNKDCRVLFMPCGHVCVCADCCPTLTICPLCRSDITNKCCVLG